MTTKSSDSLPGSFREPALGVIADDYTGGTDVASALRGTGLRTVLLFGMPIEAATADGAEAVVVALKSRNLPSKDAVRVSLDAQRWLEGRGVRRLYFKYCSTFDSTSTGNIGPVADALLEAVGAGVTVICPASPAHGRTVYQGHLFVGTQLLSESSMRDHPLTPMTDSNLVRVLGRQTPHRVGLIVHDGVQMGSASVSKELERLARSYVRHVVVDAITDEDIAIIAEAAGDLVLATGGAALARHLGKLAASGRGGLADDCAPSVPLGPCLILSGSLSDRTREQIEIAARVFPSYRLYPTEGADGPIGWFNDHRNDGPLMIYSWASPGERPLEAAPVVEALIARIARHAVAAGVRRLIVAGGETSGAVVDALEIERVIVAGEEDLGVPWLVSPTTPSLGLLLKSGNFGQPDLFTRAALR